MEENQKKNQNQMLEDTKEEIKVSEGGANESKSQPVIPVATQPKPLTMEDVGRRCQQIIRCLLTRESSRIATLVNRNKERN